jgi:hypothetical protein
VYRLPAGGDVLDLVPAYAEGNVMFGDGLTYAELTRRFDAGAELVEVKNGARDGLTTLFVVSESGELTVMTDGRRPAPRPGETSICLSPP